MHKRSFLKALAMLAGSTGLPMGASSQAQSRLLVEVWKDPNCGCCKDWVTHLESNGFQVRVHDSGNTAARARVGIPAKLGSCHTGQVGSYALEGHVPAREIRRLLKERPKVIGLALPGMPVGSPGMDGPVYGERRDPYNVLLVKLDGSTSVYQSYFQSLPPLPERKSP